MLSVRSKDKDELKPKFNIVVKGLEDINANTDEFKMPALSVTCKGLNPYCWPRLRLGCLGYKASQG